MKLAEIKKTIEDDLILGGVIFGVVALCLLLLGMVMSELLFDFLKTIALFKYVFG